MRATIHEILAMGAGVLVAAAAYQIARTVIPTDLYAAIFGAFVLGGLAYAVWKPV